MHQDQSSEMKSYLKNYLKHVIIWVTLIDLLVAMLLVKWTPFFNLFLTLEQIWLISQIAAFICYWGGVFIHLLVVNKFLPRYIVNFRHHALLSWLFLLPGSWCGIYVTNLIHKAFEKSQIDIVIGVQKGFIIGSICIAVFLIMNLFTERDKKEKSLVHEIKKLKKDEIHLIETLKYSQETSKSSDLSQEHSSFKIGGEVIVLNIIDIFAFSGAGDYVEIITSNKNYIISNSLDTLTQSLSENFLRIHRSHIVNLKKVIKLKKTSPNKYALELEDENIFPVSRQRLAVLRKHLKLNT